MTEQTQQAQQATTVQVDDVSFHVKQEHDFSWLRELGRVFCVFDQQDSGNLSFGIERDGIRRFVKYAGARPVRYPGEPRDAIARLEQAMPLYDQLRHSHLIALREHFRAGDGYAAVFDWVEGESLHPHESFPPPAKYTHPESPFYRFRQLPIEQKLAAMEAILAFHAHVEACGYVAIDFYDGSLLYDFQRHAMTICDIDMYARKPYTNTMGRMWGSSRFMSPEEFELGAAIDERTNVFNMGAMAFALLGGELDRSYERWEAGQARYEAACRAVAPNRAGRYASVAEFHAAWQQAEREG
ncbi:serine/threonine protein kinase [Paenibacillus dendritiformis]|uniref:serine/threonine protein kinase n=1 Tax=Paenibacillus dendritiformis TaxID=130049 RepID=UPI001FD28988|nr:serine/threonine protein kinase [Paenibacillus dendritiformis]